MTTGRRDGRKAGGRNGLKEEVERLKEEVERLKRENEVLNRVAVKLHRSRAAALDWGERMEKALEAIGRAAMEVVQAERRTGTPLPNSDGGERPDEG